MILSFLGRNYWSSCRVYERFLFLKKVFHSTKENHVLNITCNEVESRSREFVNFNSKFSVLTTLLCSTWFNRSEEILWEFQNSFLLSKRGEKISHVNVHIARIIGPSYFPLSTSTLHQWICIKIQHLMLFAVTLYLTWNPAINRSIGLHWLQ